MRRACPSRAGLRRSRFRAADAEDLARFLCACAPQARGTTAGALLAAEEGPQRVGTFLLRRQGAIIACLVVDECEEDGQRVAVLASAVVRAAADRALLWRELVVPLVRVFSWGAYRRVRFAEIFDV